MYHAIVRAKARKAFAQLSAGDLDGFMSVFTPSSEFCFVGDHELGGERHGDAEIRRLFDTLLERFPGLQVEPVTFVVRGWPWNTVVATRFQVSATLPSGAPYRNEGMQFLRLSWGKVVEDRLYEDTQRLIAALQVSSTPA
ncbi:MAG: hypothetical protein JWM05_2029 [Acidimicrobiales bacterium]|nr:hypothetical protein [Acidimicrobiales bacterium]